MGKSVGTRTGARLGKGVGAVVGEDVGDSDGRGADVGLSVVGTMTDAGVGRNVGGTFVGEGIGAGTFQGLCLIMFGGSVHSAKSKPVCLWGSCFCFTWYESFDIPSLSGT